MSKALDALAQFNAEAEFPRLEQDRLVTVHLVRQEVTSDRLPAVQVDAFTRSYVEIHTVKIVDKAEVVVTVRRGTMLILADGDARAMAYDKFIVSIPMERRWGWTTASTDFKQVP
jgi:hypothetical protein